MFAQLASETPVPAVTATPAARRGIGNAGRVAFALAAVAALVIGIWVVRSPDPGAEPSRVVTAGSPAQVTVARAAVTVAADSAVMIQSDSQQALLLLETGSVYCRVPTRRSGETFTVRAGDATVSVIGTAFAVSREGNGAVVEVDEGTVEIVAGGRSPGSTLASAGRAPSAPAPTGPPGDRAGRARGGRTFPPGADSPAHRAPARAVSSRPGAHAGARGGRNAGAHRGSQRPGPLPAGRPGSSRPIPTLRSPMLRRLARGGGRWAAPALYAHARLQLDRGRSREARTLLQQYLRRFPDGANAADARDLLSH